MSKFIVVNTNSDYPTFRVHRAGCRDIPLEEHKHHGHSWEREAVDAEDAVAQERHDLEVYDENPFPREAFSIAPCAKKVAAPVLVVDHKCTYKGSIFDCPTCSERERNAKA